MTMRVIITDSDHDSVDVEREVAARLGIDLELAQCRTEEGIIDAAARADGIIVQYAPISRRVFEALPHLKVVGRYGVGVDTIDVAAATEHGVVVVNVPDYGTEDVSDHAISLALTAARGVSVLDRSMRRGERYLQAVHPLHRLKTLTLGVVGLGNIGAATARKARGVGMTVIGSDPCFPVGTHTSEGVEVVSFEELMSRADIVSLHAPLNEFTFHMINAETLSAMRPGAILVNTSRGALVDSVALFEALSTGHLASAALDVFEVEPLPVDSPLLQLHNIILTPHAAWYSEESYTELKARVVENVARVCLGETPLNVVNPDSLAASRAKAALGTTSLIAVHEGAL